MRPNARALPAPAKRAGQVILRAPAVIAVAAPSIEEPVFRSYGRYLVDQMHRVGLYGSACAIVGAAADPMAAALGQVDAYLDTLDAEFRRIVAGELATVSNVNASWLHFYVGGTHGLFGRGGPFDARTALMNVRDRAARILVEACAMPLPVLQTFSVRPVMRWTKPVFFGGPRRDRRRRVWPGA